MKGGCIIGELIGKMTGGKGTLLIASFENADFYRTALRKKGLFSQIYHYYPEINIRQCTFSLSQFSDFLRDTLQNSPETPSAIYIDDSVLLREATQVVKELNLKGVTVVGHECLEGCAELLDEGWISATLCQETFSQGYYPLKLLYHYLLTGTKPESYYYSNVNIIFRSNRDLLEHNANGCGLG